MKKLSVAITLNNSQNETQMKYANGMSQNVKFLYDLLKIIGHKPYFMVFKQAAENEISFFGKKYLALTYETIAQNKIKTDIVFEAGVSVNQTQRAFFRKQFGSKIVSVRYGHSMFMDMEQLCHVETMTPGLYVNKPDAVWASPHFTEAFSYLETIYQAPVKVCPYIWEPDFISKKEENTYKPVPDIYVMEPNISILKNALIPMAIIERVFRASPDIFGKATILNGLGFNDRKYFLDNIVKNMSCFIGETQKAFFSGRYRFDQVFGERDILLGHQHGCELNYLYLEALFRNIPLVHNSPAFKDVGFYYEGCEVVDGAHQIAQAIHQGDVESEKRKNLSFIRRFSIHSKQVQSSYQKLINGLFDSL